MAQTLNKKCYWQLIKDPSNMLKVIKYCLCGYMISDTLLKQDSPIIAQPSEPYHIPPPRMIFALEDQHLRFLSYKLRGFVMLPNVTGLKK